MMYQDALRISPDGRVKSAEPPAAPRTKPGLCATSVACGCAALSGSDPRPRCLGCGLRHDDRDRWWADAGAVQDGQLVRERLRGLLRAGLAARGTHLGHVHVCVTCARLLRLRSVLYWMP